MVYCTALSLWTRRSGRKRGLDGVRDVALIGGRVDLRAVAANLREIRVRVVIQDFVDLAVVERRVQPAGQPLGTSADSARGVLRHRAERRFDASRRKTHRALEFGIEEQKFGDALGPQIGRVMAAVRFERGA